MGTKGTLFPIAEPDLRLVILDELAGKDTDALAKQMNDSGKHYSANLRQWGLTPPTTSSVRYFRPEYKVLRPVYVPQLENGEWKWIAMGQQGEIINLRDHINPHTSMLVINGQSAEQRQFATEMAKREPFRIVVVISDGDPAKLSDSMGFPIFYLTDWMHGYFNVQHTPSLLFAPKAAPHDKELAVAEFAPPFTADKLMEVWK